ncbi:MAG TPA: anthranilate synthase component I [Myxococcota bacterium]|nr:anthranilate synthase component I [Myxococcota bacterium]
MNRPQADEFAELAARGNLVPVVREVLADLDTPLSLFRQLDDGATSFLLESVQGGEKWARYSLIGVGSRARFHARGSQVEWTERGVTRRFDAQGDPLAVLRARLAEFRPVTLPGVELPRFTGGAVGMIGYDWVRFIEKIPDANPDPIGMPDVWFSFPDSVVVYDNLRHSALIVHHVDLRDGRDPRAAYAEACAKIEALVARIRGPRPADERRTAVRAPMELVRSMTPEAYQDAVKRAKEYVVAGDIFQVVLGLRFTMPLQVDPLMLYRHLRRINPSPYLFFLRMDDSVLIGSSPEILVRLESGRIDVRPIAGTRRRGRDAADDAAMEQELRSDPKEIAEHVMLVDLGRNDVGRVAEVGSVELTEYASIERYSHVMHIVSNVQGTLRAGLDWLDLLRATFPAGTLSGAPKVRAMEIIDELETLRRGPFGGCCGYVDYSGNMDLAITIRTMLAHEGKLSVQAGAGIVADSDPRLEYKECENKARALIQAIDMAREGAD